MSRNLISLGVLDSSGHTFKAENGRLIVTKGSLVIMKGQRTNGLYVLMVSTIVGSAVAIQQKEESTGYASEGSTYQ